MVTNRTSQLCYTRGVLTNAENQYFGHDDVIQPASASLCELIYLIVNSVACVRILHTEVI